MYMPKSSPENGYRSTKYKEKYNILKHFQMYFLEQTFTELSQVSPAKQQASYDVAFHQFEQT